MHGCSFLKGGGGGGLLERGVEGTDLGGEEDEAVADEAQQPEAEQHPGGVRQLFGVNGGRDVVNLFCLRVVLTNRGA